jgi:hypothetical protein
LTYDPANAVGLGALPLNEAYKFTVGSTPAVTYSISPAGNVITITGITSFSDWYAGNATAVPVTVSKYLVE